jgi:hypothetical protein
LGNYARGYDTERRIIRELEQKGYFCIRSAGSHTKIDVVALKGQDILLVQSKRTKGKVYPSSYKSDIEELQALIRSKMLPETRMPHLVVSVQLWVYQDRKGFKVFEIYEDGIEEIA